MSKEYIKAQTPLPAYFPYPKFLLQMSLSHTARLTYVLLLDRMTLSQKNGWVDVQGRAYVLYPLAGLAEDLQSSISSVTRIKILYALHDDELCVQDIANAVQLSQSAVSHQLRVLKDTKLVRFRRDGKTVYYALDDDHVRSILSMGMDHIEE